MERDHAFPNQEIIHGDCIEEMRKMESNAISAIVTDPPYGLHFMGKDWDKFKQKLTHGFNKPGQPRASGFSKSDGSSLAGTYDERRNDEFQIFITDIAREALRICKPGAHLLMFGAPRRFHRQICALEDAGWEIRDCLMWLFGQGFPKSHNFGRKIGSDWNGFGTALKPAWEPIILAMKPCEGTFAQNAEKWGVAGINVDACRINTQDILSFGSRELGDGIKYGKCKPSTEGIQNPLGRWPANLILDSEAGEMLDEMTGILTTGGGNKRNTSPNTFRGKITHQDDHQDFSGKGGASRFFYCAKTSSSERGKGNNHPTVKPIRLMQYLIKLIMPPKDGILLDPFAGSGSTIVAAKQLGVRAIGIEKCAEYVEIAKARVEAAAINQQMELFERESATELTPEQQHDLFEVS